MLKVTMRTKILMISRVFSRVKHLYVPYRSEYNSIKLAEQ